TLNSSAGAAGLLALRARVKAARCEPDVNINEMVSFCAVQALRRQPELNAQLVDGRLLRSHQVHLGFACDTPRGLLVPVIKNCQELSLTELAGRMKHLAQLAVEGNLLPDDF